MKDEVTLYEKQGAADEDPGSRFAKLDSEMLRDAYRSLSQVAFVYSAVYAAAFAYYWILTYRKTGQFWPSADNILFAATSIAFGLWVGFGTAKAKCPPSKFTKMAKTFLVVGCFGIAGNFWGWETYHAERIPDHVGVPWVGVWILMFANIVTLPPRRILESSLLGALTLPAVIWASVLFHGTPSGEMGPMEYARPIVFQLMVPTLICVGIAAYASHRVFKMAENVSEARRMGSYRLTERIGSGGMGEVWRAEHQMLARPAAIKLIRAEQLGRNEGSGARTLLARFEREAQATARLSSPHTVEIYDFGITDGTFYYVMELLEGMDLKTLVEDSGPVPAARAVRFLRQACRSLADAHRSGLIHRDVKPANLFTCRRGLEYDFVKVLDFGLVKETSAAEDDRTQLTMQGIASGTPAFMAPEMASGESELDGRADLYALACVGYWLLTGHLVFSAPSAVGMLLRHAKETPPPPSARSELEIPESLERVILDCLAKDPEDRPSSAMEMLRRLDEAERDTGVWSAERSERWWQAHLPELAAPPREAGAVPAGVS